MNMTDKWLQWARRIQAISQSGLHFSKDAFDIERYEELKQISVEIIANYSESDMKAVNNLFALEKDYQTPMMDVRGAVFKDNKIILVRERIDDRWFIQGDSCEVGRWESVNVNKEKKVESD